MGIYAKCTKANVFVMDDSLPFIQNDHTDCVYPVVYRNAGVHVHSGLGMLACDFLHCRSTGVRPGSTFRIHHFCLRATKHWLDYPRFRTRGVQRLMVDQ